MRSQTLKLKLFKVVLSSAISMVAVMIGQRVASAMCRAKARQLAEDRLDEALQDSMDCSDAVAKY
ncbi:MAG: hypothetical protein K8R88_06410 [Armatimonadetes bacterium]|nr:hypothetical protein [Armatimonadota bacterium]